MPPTRNAATFTIAVLVSAATAYAVGRATARETVPTEGASLAALAEAVRSLERTIAESRPAARPPSLAAGPAPAAEARPVEVAERPVSHPPPAAEAGRAAPRTAPATKEGGEMLPAADLSRADEIDGWDQKEEVRRRWFLVSDREVLSVFGTPNGVSGWESGERWDYRNERWSLSFCFLTGRLVAVYSTDRHR
jgi:hypothetical protein